MLKNILKKFSIEEISQNIKVNPKRILSKKIWFFYEFLLDTQLPIEDLPIGKYDDLLDEKNIL